MVGDTRTDHGDRGRDVSVTHDLTSDDISTQFFTFKECSQIQVNRDLQLFQLAVPNVPRAQKALRPCQIEAERFLKVVAGAQSIPKLITGHQGHAQIPIWNRGVLKVDTRP